MNFPFFKNDKEWQELRPKDLDLIGQSDDLDPTQKKFLEVFRIADLRIEWNCRLSILHHNMLVSLFGLLLIIAGPRVVEIIISLITK